MLRICENCFDEDKINEYYKRKFECHKMVCTRTSDNIDKIYGTCKGCAELIKNNDP